MKNETKKIYYKKFLAIIQAADDFYQNPKDEKPKPVLDGIRILNKFCEHKLDKDERNNHIIKNGKAFAESLSIKSARDQHRERIMAVLSSLDS